MKGLGAALAVAICATVPAAAAVTKAKTFACREEAVLYADARLKQKKDDKAIAAFEKPKVDSGECIVIPAATKVGVDLHKPLLMCVRSVGDLDCYWAPAVYIDEFPRPAGLPGAQPEPAPEKK